jgi:DNA mismatch repair protein MutS2
VRELSHLDWLEILKQLQSFATSGVGRMQLGQLSHKASVEEARLSMTQILDAAQVVSLGTRPFMESLDLFEPWHNRVKRNAVLKTLEIKDVRHFCLEAIALREVIQEIQNPWCQKISSSLMEATEPLSAIDQIMTPRGDIRSDASETLYRLFREKENLARQIHQTLDRLVKDYRMEETLQDKYVTTREGRWVLPVRSGKQHSLDGIIHGSSQTKQTVFMEPESIVPMNNRLRQVEVEIEDEIERLLVELSKYLYGLNFEFQSTRDLLEEADVAFAKAQWSLRVEAQVPQFSEDVIELNEVRHPLLLLSGKPVIANSVSLDQKKSVLLLSGPNAGGKTVLLKSIGLAAQMACCGLPICAQSSSKIPFFQTVLVGIGDSQDVGEELSTFAAHLKVLQKAVALKGPKHLILIDEICGSTDPEEGAALARSFIEAFARHEVFSVITSHLGPLKTGWKNEERVLNGSMEYDSKSGRPSYQYLQGVPGDSLAIQTAKRVGVDSHLLARAVELLSPESRIRLSGLEELENLKSDLQHLRDHLKKEQSRANFEKEKYQKLLVEIEKEKENQIAKAVRQAEKKIDEMVALAKAEATFKKHTALSEIKYQMPEIIKPKVGASTPVIETAEDFAQRFPAGTKVYVPSLNQDGLIQSTPNSKGEVLVLSGSIRLNLKWQDLRPAQKSSNPTNDIIRRSSAVTTSFIENDKTLDLRGLTVEEALSKLEIQLDGAASEKEDRIKIIHGHGTEALKKAVRTYLSRSVYVKKWKAGTPEQGGDGITWVEISID